MIPELETERMWLRPVRLPSLRLRGTVVTVGEVNSNQILRHDFSSSCNCLRAGQLPAFTT